MSRLLDVEDVLAHVLSFLCVEELSDVCRVCWLVHGVATGHELVWRHHVAKVKAAAQEPGAIPTTGARQQFDALLRVPPSMELYGRMVDLMYFYDIWEIDRMSSIQHPPGIFSKSTEMNKLVAKGRRFATSGVMRPRRRMRQEPQVPQLSPPPTSKGLLEANDAVNRSVLRSTELMRLWLTAVGTSMAAVISIPVALLNDPFHRLCQRFYIAASTNSWGWIPARASLFAYAYGSLDQPLRTQFRHADGAFAATPVLELIRSIFSWNGLTSNAVPRPISVVSRASLAVIVWKLIADSYNLYFVEHVLWMEKFRNESSIVAYKIIRYGFEVTGRFLIRYFLIQRYALGAAAVHAGQWPVPPNRVFAVLLGKPKVAVLRYMFLAWAVFQAVKGYRGYLRNRRRAIRSSLIPVVLGPMIPLSVAAAVSLPYSRLVIAFFGAKQQIMGAEQSGDNISSEAAIMRLYAAGAMAWSVFALPMVEVVIPVVASGLGKVSGLRRQFDLAFGKRLAALRRTQDTSTKGKDGGEEKTTAGGSQTTPKPPPSRFRTRFFPLLFSMSRIYFVEWIEGYTAIHLGIETAVLWRAVLTAIGCACDRARITRRFLGASGVLLG